MENFTITESNMLTDLLKNPKEDYQKLVLFIKRKIKEYKRKL